MIRESERSARFGPFLLDLQTGELSRKGRKVRLQPQPFQLLRLLLERSGKVVGEEDIRATLWPDAPFVDFEHGVGTAIKKLRDALGDNPVRPFYIETLRRRGYRFIASVTFHSRNPNQDAPRPRAIVGRDPALEELQDSLQHALQQERQLVFLSGEAGIGKSALVDEFVRRATAATPALQVIRGQCVEGYGGKEPYYPILEALAELCRTPGGAMTIELLIAQAPTLIVQLPTLVKRQDRERLARETAGATRERMLRETRQAIEAIASSSPLIVLLEDLQWVDPSTLDLISALARQRTAAKLMLIGTYRPLEVALADHPLRGLKQDLILHSLCREIPLGRLGEGEVAEYLAAQSPGVPLPAGLARAVHRQSGGNPLFMITTLAHMFARGLISRDRGEWRMGASVEQITREVPETLRDMIEAQIGRLTSAEQRVLEVASIAGITFAVDVCTSAAAEVQAEAFEETCERLARRHHIVRAIEPQQHPGRTPSARYEFVHALYRQVFYERQPRGRRTLLHLRIGEQMEVLWSDRLSEVATELAGHFEEAADWSRAVHYFRLASYVAEARYAHPEACAVLEEALRSVRLMPDDERSVHEIAILEKLALLYVASSDIRAIETYETLAARSAHYGYLEVEVRALTHMAFPLSWISAERCMAVLDRALLLSPGLRDPVLRATTRASCFALRLSVDGWNPEYIEEFHKALAEVHASGDHVLIATHQIDLSAIQLGTAEYRQAHRNATESIAVLQAHERNIFLNPAAWRGRVYSIWSLLFAGEWGQARREIDAAMAVAEKNGNSKRLESYRLLLAWLHLMAMDPASVLEIARNGMETQGDPARTVPSRFSTILAGAAEVGLGRPDVALELLLTARREMQRHAVVRDVYWRMTLESTLAELWLTKGDFAQARIHAEAFAQTAMKTADRTWHALAWDLHARVAMAEGAFARAEEHSQKALTAMSDLDLPLAAWRVHATLAELYERQGNTNLAEEHRVLSARVIGTLADSLAEHDSLQRTFVSAPAIQKILQGNASVPAG